MPIELRRYREVISCYFRDTARILLRAPWRHMARSPMRIKKGISDDERAAHAQDQDV